MQTGRKWLFDLHCHPSLKYTILPDEIFSVTHKTAGGIFSFEYPFELYYDVPGSLAGGVGVLVNNHYVPEYIFNKSLLLNTLDSIQPSEIIEDFDEGIAPNTDAWSKLMKSIEKLEAMVKEANQALGANTVAILDSAANLSKLRGENKIVVINALEGAHHLGRNLSLPEYTKNLDILKEKGFCSFTLGHFSRNSVVDSAGGIPPSDFFTTGYSTPSPNEQGGLEKLGPQVVEYALKNGFLIDLVHSSLKARKEVYKINQNLHDADGLRIQPKPLAFTHTGLWDLYAQSEKASWEFVSFLPHYYDVKEIIATNGIIGVILMNYWLDGFDDDGDHTQSIFASIDYVGQVAADVGKTGDDRYGFIGIGTDLDGFTHVPDVYNQCSKLGALRHAILHKYGETVTEKIFNGNAMRVFAEACGAV